VGIGRRPNASLERTREKQSAKVRPRRARRSAHPLGGTETNVPTIIALRQRPEFCEFFARQFEAEWPNWYGPGGQGNATADLMVFANPQGDLPAGVIAIDDDAWDQGGTRGAGGSVCQGSRH